ncbi:MAG: HlyD family secretion protein [Rhodospirillaceae bacterium]|nr:HlyD family secretion protein [Rhodospirillaceae bacterium]
MRRRGFKRALMWGVPLLVVLWGAYAYLTGGRYVSTDDAYVKAGIVTVSSDVAGRVVAVAVKENQHVAKGAVLFRLDDRPYRYALERAEANLAQARLQVDGLHANYRQKQAELKAARETLAYQRRQVERNRALLATRAVSPSAFDAMQNQLQVAEQTVVSTEQQIASIRASLGGNPDAPVDDHPLVKQAQAQVDQAKLDLDRTVIHAPVDGIVSKADNLQPGQYLNVGTAAFALVATRVWIEANFKETEITHMRAGNAATVTIDTYPGHSFQARIDSIGAATGSEFSILPPQNATGNWVKVTQRVPVRLVLIEPNRGLALRAGMSVGVEVDTHYRRPAMAVIERAIAGTADER